MPAFIEILSPGIACSVQDKGRPGYGNSGVPRGGALDQVALRLGNALLGNDPFEAALEFRLIGPTVKAVDGPVRIGLACHAAAEIISGVSQEIQSLQAWQSCTLQAGDTLKVQPLSAGASGYLTIAGGLDIEPALGSLSTYVRAGFGGGTGQLLKSGDKLPLKIHTQMAQCDRFLPEPLATEADDLRVIPGPQDDYFSEEQLEAFLTRNYQVSADSDRMGVRLKGEPVSVLPEKGSDLVSEGLIAGSIQVPGNGLPIILAADCQTVGGYPKIATVISADLHKLGQLKPGDRFSFKSVTLRDAREALLKLESLIGKKARTIRDYYGIGSLDLKSLYEQNLVDGVVDAANPGHFPGHLETE